MPPTALQRCAALALFTVATACGGRAPGPAATAETPNQRVRLVDITRQSGLPAPTRPRPAGTFFLPEIMGAGVALFDYDGDGDLDILQVRFPQSGRPGEPAPNRLLEQREGLRFVDVTNASGLGDAGYGQGVAVGDADNDGDLDVYLANYGRDRFYRNEGDGTFRDVTDPSGLGADSWSSVASFCDYDRDGYLDLYVVHYLRYEFRGMCHHGGGFQDYCAPSMFDGVADKLYHNEGDGTFRDVTQEAGVVSANGGKAAKGLGLICADLTADGWVDFFVANDGEMNQLWVNRRDGTFSEEAIMRGLAVNRQGAPEASMGTAVGDVNGDGEIDVFLTHVVQETNTLYQGFSEGRFGDRTAETGLGPRDMPLTGFGCGLLDLDHDGDLDLVVANGRVYRGPVLAGADLGPHWNLYAEPDLLYLNDGTGRLLDSGPGGEVFTSRVEIGRGLALGDIDNDGDIDLVVANNSDTLRLYRNDTPSAGSHWLSVRALSGLRDAVGARLMLIGSGVRKVGLVLPGASYQSSNDPRVHFGLGSISRVDGIEVAWPDGRLEWFDEITLDRHWTLVQGRGEAR